MRPVIQMTSGLVPLYRILSDLILSDRMIPNDPIHNDLVNRGASTSHNFSDQILPILFRKK